MVETREGERDMLLWGRETRARRRARGEKREETRAGKRESIATRSAAKG